MAGCSRSHRLLNLREFAHAEMLGPLGLIAALAVAQFHIPHAAIWVRACFIPTGVHLWVRAELFNETRHARSATLTQNRLRPCQIEWACAWSRLSADNRPINRLPGLQIV